MFNDNMKMFNDNMKMFIDIMKMFNDIMKMFNDNMKMFNDNVKLFNDNMKLFNDKMKMRYIPDHEFNPPSSFFSRSSRSIFKQSAHLFHGLGHFTRKLTQFLHLI